MSNTTPQGILTGVVIGGIVVVAVVVMMVKVIAGFLRGEKGPKVEAPSRYAEVTHPGGTTLRVGDLVSYQQLEMENASARKWGGAPARAKALPR